MDSLHPDLEELTICSSCKHKFDDVNYIPKLLVCKHYFCLECIRTTLAKGQPEIYCIHCWKRTDFAAETLQTASNLSECLPTNQAILALTMNFAKLQLVADATLPNGQNGSGTSASSTSSSGGGGSGGASNDECTKSYSNAAKRDMFTENCVLHATPLSAWCTTCCLSLCCACLTMGNEHQTHQVKTVEEVRDQFLTDIQIELVTISKLVNELQRMQVQRREFQLKVLEACTMMKLNIENDLSLNSITLQTNMELLDLVKDRFHAKLKNVNGGGSGSGGTNNGLFNETNNNNPNPTSSHDSENINDLYNVFVALKNEKIKIKTRLQELFVQNQCDEIVPRINSFGDIGSIKQTFTSLLNRYTTTPITNGHIPQMPITSSLPNHQLASIQTLTNYLLFQMFLKGHQHQQQQQQQQQHQHQHQDYHGSLKTIMNNNNSSSSSNNNNKIPLLTSPSVSLTSTLNGTNLNGLSHTPSQLTHSSSSSSSSSAPTYLIDPVLLQSKLLTGGCYPTYYFNIEVNSTYFGRIVIEVRPDVAPKMAKNFDMLACGELGFGYKNCSIFQCWENESIITGDYEMNNGRGGKSPMTEDGHFLPDDTKILAMRGSVGMRRSQKKHDNCGSVASQFRIVVQEMRGFTGIFGHVVEGIELVDKISAFGDSTGKPSKSILIADCGKLSN